MMEVFDKYLHIVSQRPDENLLYLGQYSLGLVALSVGIAVFAAYTALLVADFAERTEHVRTRQMLLMLGGLALGVGIWSMHFVGMLGFELPCGVSYNPWITAFSMIPGVVASIFSLRIITQRHMDWQSLLIGGTLFGAGVGIMHYVGMAAMQMESLLRYDVWMFLLSIVVAVVLAILALWIRAGILRFLPMMGSYSLLASALVMGGAVSGMHYTAMAASYFVQDDSASSVIVGFEPLMLAVVIAGATGLLIGSVLIYVFRHFLREMEESNRQTQQTLSQLQRLLDSQSQSVWVKEASAKVIAAIQRQNDIGSFGRQLMQTLPTLLAAEVAAFYCLDQSTQAYRMIGSFGFKSRQGFQHLIQAGQGLAGQCALEAQIIALHSPTDNALLIDGTPPNYALAAPLKALNGQVLAVIEIAASQTLGDKEQALLEELLPMLTLNLELLDKNQPGLDVADLPLVMDGA